MNVYSDLIKMTLREGTTKQSLVGAMDSFFNAMDQMNHTIMMPSRLMDIQLGNLANTKTDSDKENAIIAKSAPSSDLYSFYQLLKTVRQDLINGGTPSDDEMADSSGSDDLSDNDDNCNKMDEQCKDVANAFRHHLIGLHSTLNHLTEAAQFLQNRYQDQLDADACANKL